MVRFRYRSETYLIDRLGYLLYMSGLDTNNLRLIKIEGKYDPGIIITICKSEFIYIIIRNENILIFKVKITIL